MYLSHPSDIKLMDHTREFECLTLLALQVG